MINELYKQTRVYGEYGSLEKEKFDKMLEKMRDSTTFKSFENDKSDAKSPRHIPTINEHLEGKCHPLTGVPFVKRVFYVNGEKVEGVFPKFNSKFDVRIPKELYKASDEEQFKYCVKQLAKKIESDPEFAKQFTPRQIEQIKNGETKISGLTWHHNERPGLMQLVSSDEHSRTAHTGGRCIWGGGTNCR